MTMFFTQIFQQLLHLSLFWCICSSLLPQRESQINDTKSVKINGLYEQMMEDVISRDWRKSVELMRILLDSRTQVYKELNNITEYYNYPLLAAERGYIELIQVMLYNGLPINKGYDCSKTTMLHYAAKYGQYELVNFLIQQGADVNARESLKTTPLHNAVNNGHVNTVQLLVDSGADIDVTDEFGETPLHWAARNGYESIVQILVYNGCNIAARNIWLETASDIAKTQRIKDIILKQQDYPGNIIKGLHEQMLEDIKLGDWHKSVQLMHKHLDHNTLAYKQINNITDYNYPLVVAKNGYTELIKIMLNNGLPINTGFMRNYTMLHYAAAYGQYNLAKILIKQGANVNVKNSWGATPLHTAAWKGEVNTARLLVQHGADVTSTDSSGETPLHRAALGGHLNIVQLLVDSGADINVIDKNGNTPLHHAVIKENKLVVQWLIEKGCNTTIRNKHKKTALYYAQTQEIKDIIKRADH